MVILADAPLPLMGPNVHKESISVGILEPGAEQLTPATVNVHVRPTSRRLPDLNQPATSPIPGLGFPVNRSRALASSRGGSRGHVRDWVDARG